MRYQETGTIFAPTCAATVPNRTAAAAVRSGPENAGQMAPPKAC